MWRGNDEAVLLQTANGYITDPNEKKILSATILFDSCSQQTYVRENIIKRLNIEPIRRLNMKVKAFGSNDGKDMVLKEYQIVLKPNDRNSNIYVKALAIPDICAPVSGHDVDLVLKQNDSLNNLQLG